MCFSAAASFGAGAFLAAAGTATLTQAKKPSQIPFAVIPMLFSIQQFSEGFVWLSLTDEAYQSFNAPATYVFLVFAQAVWTFWVPWSLYFLEPKQRRKKPLLFFSILGICVSLFLCWRLFATGAEAKIEGCHIAYNIVSPQSLVIAVSLLYLATVLVPLFVSTHKFMPWLGVLLLLSLVAAELFYEIQFLSVWCFFAALLSGAIFFVLKQFRVQLPGVRKHGSISA